MERLSLALPYNPVEFAIHSLRYLPLRRASRGKRVLDIACGEGLGTSLIRTWGAARVVGVDISEIAISVANSRSGRGGKQEIEFICADAITYLEGLADEFDIIISAETIEHLDDPRRFLKLCRSRLASNGSLVVTCPNDHYYYGSGQTLNRHHISSYSFQEFRDLSEDILGQGTWSLGAPLNGFGLFPLPTTRIFAENYGNALVRRKGLTGESIPVPAERDDGLDPKNSLFYVGIWGPLALRGALGVAVPYGSDYRMGELRSVSEDVAQGTVRDLALVHDDNVTSDEIDALRDLLREKYAVVAIAWTGDIEALASELLYGHVFDNLHFENPEAFDALVDWVSRSALTPDFSEVIGARWSSVTLTVRPDVQLPSSHSLSFADGTFGRAAIGRHSRTAAGDRAVLWGAEPLLDENQDAGSAAPLRRIIVRMPTDAEVDSVKTLIAAAQERAGVAELAVSFISSSLPPQKIVASLARTDALLCLDGSGAARRLAEQAIRQGLAVILPVAHPLTPLLGVAQKPLIMVQPDIAALSQALFHVYMEPDTRTRIRAENLALAQHMTSNARGVSWTRALAQAQITCGRYGGPLRAAALKAMAQAARSVSLIALRTQ